MADRTSLETVSSSVTVLAIRSTLRSGELSPDQSTKSAKAIKHETDRIAKIISSLLDFSRQRSGQRVKTDLAELVCDTVELLRPMAKKHGATVSFDQQSEDVTALVDPNQLQQVLTNLINNAFQSGSESGDEPIAVKVDTRNDVRDGKPGVLIEVADNGDGIQPEIAEDIFDPFFTTKEVGQGTGLGLAISQGIVHDHDGQLEFASELGQGTKFRVWLPGESAK